MNFSAHEIFSPPSHIYIYIYILMYILVCVFVCLCVYLCIILHSRRHIQNTHFLLWWRMPMRLPSGGTLKCHQFLPVFCDRIKQRQIPINHRLMFYFTFKHIFLTDFYNQLIPSIHPHINTHTHTNKHTHTHKHIYIYIYIRKTANILMSTFKY